MNTMALLTFAFFLQEAKIVHLSNNTETPVTVAIADDALKIGTDSCDLPSSKDKDRKSYCQLFVKAFPVKMVIKTSGQTRMLNVTASGIASGGPQPTACVQIDAKGASNLSPGDCEEMLDFEQ